MNGESRQEMNARRARIVARLRENPNATQVAREFGTHRPWVSKLARQAGIRLQNGRPYPSRSASDQG